MVTRVEQGSSAAQAGLRPGFVIKEVDGQPLDIIIEQVGQVSLMRQAADRGACRRETPVTFQLGDGTMLEGTVDLAFKEADHWIVVDYKTDREIAQANDQYVRQVAVYAQAIASATGCTAEGVILRVVRAAVGEVVTPVASEVGTTLEAESAVEPEEK